MAKIVFFCIPAHGHTNPTLEVVRELVSLGHEVLYYSYNMLQEKIEATGAKFISCDDYNMEQKLSPREIVRIGKDLAFSTKILVDTTLALDEMVCEEMEKMRPDCIVADSMAIWGKCVAMKLGIPFVSSTTTFAFNQHSAKIMKQSIWQVLKMIFSMGKIQNDIKRLQAKGYPINNVLDIIQNNDSVDTVVYTSPEFQPASETFSDKYVFVGPSIRPAVSQIEKTHEKLIYISMGTVVNNNVKFYHDSIKAFAKTNYQVIMSVGNLVDMKEFENLPENINVYQSVDQIAVLSKADVFISHCGMNSVNESLYCGVPLVMYPQTPEQGGVASRVEQLKAGILLKKSNAANIRNAVETLFNNEEYRKNVQCISAGFKKCSGAKGAVKKILSVF
ncbi:MAG: glycosyltransferase [Spirochaetales bacterium]|nr:glycosyltransferase [Spirochaetales bacterium]